MNDVVLKKNLRRLRVPEPSEVAKGRALHRALIALEQRDSLPDKPARKSLAWLWGGVAATFALLAVIQITQPNRLLEHRGDYRNLSVNEAELRLLSENKALVVDQGTPLGLEQRMLLSDKKELDAPRSGVIARPVALARPSSEVVFQNRVGIREVSDGSAVEVNGQMKAKLAIGGAGGALGNANTGTLSAAAIAPISTGNGDQIRNKGGSTISGSVDASGTTHDTPVSAANISNSDALVARERSSVGGVLPALDRKSSPAISLAEINTPGAPAAPHAQDSPEKEQTNQTAEADPINTLVADFSRSYGLWENGAFPIIDLPQAATPEEVLGKMFKMTSFGNSQVKDFKVLEIRMIQIKNSGSGSYHAALVQTDLGKKVVLFNCVGRGLWWSRVFDANKTYYVKPSPSPAESVIPPILNSLFPNDQYDLSKQSQKTPPPDSIGDLVAQLSAQDKWGLWLNGLFKPIQLSSSASPEEVIAQLNKQTNLYQGSKLQSYKIIESRQVNISSALPDKNFTAVLLETNLGKRIVLLHYQGASVGWWSRVYDAPAPPSTPKVSY